MCWRIKKISRRVGRGTGMKIRRRDPRGISAIYFLLWAESGRIVFAIYHANKNDVDGRPRLRLIMMYGVARWA